MKSTKFKGGHASLLLYKYSETVPKTQYIMRILCKIVCILRVYYKYIASILLSNFYSNLRTLTVKIRTIKPRKHRISGVRFYQLADTLSHHGSSTGFQCLCGFCPLLYIIGILPSKIISILSGLSPIYSLFKYADEQKPVSLPYAT